MAESFKFDYELPNGAVLKVSYTATLGLPALAPSNARPGEPAEDPDIEVTSIVLVCCAGQFGKIVWPDFDVDGLYIKKPQSPTDAINKVPLKYVALNEVISDAAWDHFVDQQAMA